MNYIDYRKRNHPAFQAAQTIENQRMREYIEHLENQTSELKNTNDLYKFIAACCMFVTIASIIVLAIY